jgi:hypothetical protein
MLEDAGFEQVRVEQLPHDIMNYYYIAVPSAEVPTEGAGWMGDA